MASILISYSHRDSEFVDKLYQHLTQMLLVESPNVKLQPEAPEYLAEMPLESPDAFLDKTAILPAMDWFDQIRTAIDDHDTFLFVISPDSVASQVCSQEVAHAVAGHKRIVTLLYRPTDPNLLPPGIQAVQWIDFTDPASFDRTFQQLLVVLETDVAHWQRATELMQVMRKWERNQREPSYALKGKALRDAERWLREGKEKKPAPRPDLMAFIQLSRRLDRIQFFSDIWSIGFLLLPLLAIIGIFYAVKGEFPTTAAFGGGILAGLVILFAILISPFRRFTRIQWRNTHKVLAIPFSLVLAGVVAFSPLLISPSPAIVSQGYDFSYHPVRNVLNGGSATVDMSEYDGPTQPPPTLNPYFAGSADSEITPAMWNSCLIQEPDLHLGAYGWFPDQCTAVPSIANNDQSPDFKTTTLHIDPKDRWSDGQSLTADDFMFGCKILTDPAFGGYYFSCEKLDMYTIQLTWAQPDVNFLRDLEYLFPLPLHIYNTGKFKGIYDPTKNIYNPSLTQKLVASDIFNTTIPVDNGPFTLQQVTIGTSTSRYQDVVQMVRNNNFYSNFFKGHPGAGPFLDRVTFQ